MSPSVVSAREKFEHSVGLEVEFGVVTVLAEGEAWLARTGHVGGLSGSDIILSGPTLGEDWDQQYINKPVHVRNIQNMSLESFHDRSDQYPHVVTQFNSVPEVCNCNSEEMYAKSCDAICFDEAF